MAETLVYGEPPPVSGLLARGMVPRRRGNNVAPSLPDRVVRMSRHRASVERWAAYARVCGFRLADRVPATWVHVLAFPLQTALLTQPDVPFAPAGLVHLRNTMTLHEPITALASLDFLVRPGEVRPHPKGWAFDVVSEARFNHGLAWSGVSTYLARGTSSAEEAAAVDLADDKDEWPTASQRWRLSSDLGRRYARVSGDINPIHLSPITARIFGYQRPLVHGMWSHARAVAALGHLPERYRVEVFFRRPILVPTTVGFVGEASAFAVLNSSGKPALTGRLIPG